MEITAECEAVVLIMIQYLAFCELGNERFH